MKCPKCHLENTFDSAFCRKCGTRFDSPGQASLTKTLETASDDLARGVVFAGRYEIIEELGAGGMGRVYRAQDTKLNEEVALKLIKPEIAAERTAVERFHNEIRIARKITHKNVCRTYDLHEEGKRLYRSPRALDILLTVEYIICMRLLNLSGKKRLRPLSGDLESAIMEILWTKGPMKGRDLHVEIRREKEIAYTTALTVLGRLSEKGFIKKDRDSGMISFSPRISREVYRNSVTEDLVQKAFDVSPDLAVSAFAGLFSKMSKEDLDRLEKLIKEKKNAALK